MASGFTRTQDSTIQVQSSRPDRVPPKNNKGQIICEHSDCHDKQEVFRRPCEWNKHMDKHERPYKCNDTLCEQNPGFTYSGGLLRHMREVHKVGLGPTRKPLYCPHANCVRSQGDGFTRRENLEEHMRRRHSHSGVISPRAMSSPRDGHFEGTIHNLSGKRRRTESELEQPTGDQDSEAQSKRRCKRDEYDDDYDDDDDDASSAASSPRARRIHELEQEISRCHEKIAQQEHELKQLRGTISSIPSGRIYNCDPPSLPSPTLSTVHQGTTTADAPPPAAPHTKSQVASPKWQSVVIHRDHEEQSAPEIEAKT